MTPRLLWNNDGHGERTFGFGVRACVHQATLYVLFWHLTLVWWDGETWDVDDRPRPRPTEDGPRSDSG